MSRRAVLNAFLLLLLAGTIAANLGIHPEPGLPNVELFPEMAHSPRYNAYAPNPNFADGKTLQAPAEGSVPRGFLPVRYAANEKDALRAGEELGSPAVANEKTLARGKFVFDNFCQTCHGPEGAGNGHVIARGVPAPPPLTADKARKMKDGQMFHVLTFGQNNMASYAGQVSREDRWAVIAYVRELQRMHAATQVAGGAPAATAGETPQPPAGETENVKPGQGGQP